MGGQLELHVQAVAETVTKLKFLVCFKRHNYFLGCSKKQASHASSRKQITTQRIFQGYLLEINLTSLKITSEVKNTLKRLFLTFFYSVFLEHLKITLENKNYLRA